ncbi:hypothetical protein M441DRAFT_341926 [Trichoderma asperellum CBS 433.97]|uniref:Uncharacterized protein n=1 Tax=Trichoderma asperellum (strain ATCC 204424 / CBS 433.97 / NBRC 101777) TaxID=1042311 RepID=A0A2T3ZH54_TRIA4|nr:hypothetical protein M441DRAFT_341926 [Trichoderma asperellum CBS 433.97]PTB44122.1 hypothetical protein M441DRAFT_341926 [Trichoderma asperellum CBS 433.97]
MRNSRWSYEKSKYRTRYLQIAGSESRVKIKLQDAKLRRPDRRWVKTKMYCAAAQHLLLPPSCFSPHSSSTLPSYFRDKFLHVSAGSDPCSISYRPPTLIRPILRSSWLGFWWLLCLDMIERWRCAAMIGLVSPNKRRRQRLVQGLWPMRCTGFNPAVLDTT